MATSDDVVTDRPQRADARRNRTRILDAAARLFASHGSAVSIEQIANEAGVGAGTIYRHFANRDALLEAIVVGRLTELEQTVRASSGTAAEALFEMIAALGASAATDIGLVEALAEAKDEGHAHAAMEASFLALIDELLTAAQRSGEIRSDVSASTVKAMIVGQQAAAQSTDPDAARLHLAVIEAGLAAEA